MWQPNSNHYSQSQTVRAFDSTIRWWRRRRDGDGWRRQQRRRKWGRCMCLAFARQRCECIVYYYILHHVRGVYLAIVHVFRVTQKPITNGAHATRPILSVYIINCRTLYKPRPGQSECWQRRQQVSQQHTQCIHQLVVFDGDAKCHHFELWFVNGHVESSTSETFRDLRVVYQAVSFQPANKIVPRSRLSKRPYCHSEL